MLSLYLWGASFKIKKKNLTSVYVSFEVGLSL